MNSFYQWMYKVLEGRSYRLQHPWVGIVNRSQADINKNVDMIAARQKEREYFESSPEYGHLAHKMGSEYLAKLLSQVFFLLFLLSSSYLGSVYPFFLQFTEISKHIYIKPFPFFWISIWSLSFGNEFQVLLLWLIRQLMSLMQSWIVLAGLLQ